MPKIENIAELFARLAGGSEALAVVILGQLDDARLDELQQVSQRLADQAAREMKLRRELADEQVSRKLRPIAQRLVRLLLQDTPSTATAPAVWSELNSLDEHQLRLMVQWLAVERLAHRGAEEVAHDAALTVARIFASNPNSTLAGELTRYLSHPAWQPLIPLALIEQAALGEGLASLALRKRVITDFPIPTATLLQVALDENVNIRHLLAENETTPGEVLHLLAEDGEPYIVATIARNPATPGAVLTQLAESERKIALDDIAANPSTPPATLISLARQAPRLSMQCNLACNSACPPELLEELAQHPEYDVRCAVARNLTCPPTLLGTLAADYDSWVRSAAATNPRLPDEVLKRLTHDRSSTVRNAAKQETARRQRASQSIG